MLLFFNCKKNNNLSKFSSNERVLSFIEDSKKSNNAIYLYKADSLNSRINNDLIQNRNLLKISYQAYKLKDTNLFKETNLKAYKLSNKLKDTFGLADTHWNFGAFYGDKERLDSSYYHFFQAYKYFELLKHQNYSAKMLYNMAFIQSRTTDFIEAEAKLFQAISKNKSINKYKSLIRCYSLLGSIYSEIEDFENSISYHEKALDELERLKDNSTFKERILNDLGVTFQLKKEYGKSISYFKEALNNDSLKQLDVNLFAKTLDNLSYSKLLLGDTLDVKLNFEESLKIREQENNYSGIVINKIHLAEYHIVNKDTLKAIKSLKEAYNLAKKVKNNRDVLSSLKLLSKIEIDSSSSHLKKYVSLSDRLKKEERQLNNTFARIRFETDEYIEKAEKLRLQKSLLFLSIIALLLIFSLAYFIRIQKNKNKELLFQSQQQLANEEIYKLLLVQKSKLEEGRVKERQRISEELHDGIIGKIFGARIGLGFLNIEGDKETQDKHDKYLDNLQKIEEEIRDISHKLKSEILSTKDDYISIIEDLVREKSELGNFDYQIFNEDPIHWNEASEEIKINIYRIIQEVLQNILKHSQAKQVKLKFKKIKENLILEIIDNGIGFDVKNSKKGIGLKNIKSRINKLEGNIELNSDVKRGTSIKLKVPINKK